ncbi:MAG: 2-phospho-L-lactate guanylyltransferase [Thermoproteota archaeon]|nr:MAG: 2-phospho-L-lactate guanylyltransferase [Candidatus Korarchaeota archaeon]RLG52768.1 MAG: 2-phospho-L-lactate guanylyltransferase [Candidatus Korarchaeota archaeon]
MSLCAVVPVKEVRSAKRRLSAVLSADERAKLALLMLADVLHALTECSEVSGVYVVSRDRYVKKLAAGYGCKVIDDEGYGLSASVQKAISMCFEREFSRVLVVHSDLPLLSPKEVLEVAGYGGDLVLAPSKNLGTTGVLIRYGSGFTPLYGELSFARNVMLAASLGLDFRAYYSVGFLLDLDLPQDILYVVRSGVQSEARRYLEEIGAESRVLSKLVST